MSILAALFARAKTGKGQLVEVNRCGKRNGGTPI